MFKEVVSVCVLQETDTGAELDISEIYCAKPGKEHVKAVHCHPAYLT